MKNILQKFSDLKGKVITDVCEGFTFVDEEEELSHVAIHVKDLQTEEDSVLILETSSTYSMETDTKSRIGIVASLPSVEIGENLMEQLKLN